MVRIMRSYFRIWKKLDNNITNLSNSIPDNSCMYCSYIYWCHLSSLQVMGTRSSTCRNTNGFKAVYTHRYKCHIYVCNTNDWIADGNSNSEYGTTSAQYQRTQSGMQPIWKITIGLLIMVMLLSVLPRIILGLVVIAHPLSTRYTPLYLFQTYFIHQSTFWPYYICFKNEIISSAFEVHQQIMHQWKSNFIFT